MSGLRKFFAAAALLVTVLAGTSSALLREGAVAGREGLSFSRVIYRFDHLFIDITNGTKKNVIFGGSMVFLDRNRRPIARAELLPEHIKRGTTRRYRARITEGSGNEASAAYFLMWELDQRNN